MQADKKVVTIISIVTVILVVGIFVWGNQIEKRDQQTIEQSKGDASQTLAQYTATDVSTHNNTASCWTIIDGFIYDLTQFIGRHPGGEKAISNVCGVDGAAVFQDAHHGSTRKMAELQKYLIGVLKQ